MAETYKSVFIKRTRLYLYGLVFFLLLSVACQNHVAGKLTIVWKNNQAVGILIPNDLIEDIDEYPLTVSLNGSDHSMLGFFTKTDTGILFQPPFPLRGGMEYGVLQQNRVVGKVKVPANAGKYPPEVLAVYPLADTVPENLLKLYIQFSKPMQTGKALEHIFLLDNNRDTLDRIFLNLQPELWGNDDKVLTLWIDPGRIKRDLALNKELGNPLHANQHYELVITGGWKDRRGLILKDTYSKKFIAANRTDRRLDIYKWHIWPPKPSTKNRLGLTFNAPLDHYLLLESIAVLTADGKEVTGTVALDDDDKTWLFTPAENWKAGNYKMRVDARLEDLGGNNLNKVFDRDIYKQQKADNAFYEREFSIRP